MKKILNILLITSLVFINNSCKKNNIDIVDNTSIVFNKFYASTENTKPVVKKVIEQIKQSGRYNDLEKFATEYGFPKWDKALIHPKKEIQLDDDSSAAEEYVIIPTVLENDNKVNGFIAVETTINGINFQTFLGTDYKRFPYESITTTGATAELMVGILLALEHETFDYEKFSITDSQLSFYRAPQNSEDIALLEIKPEQTSLTGRTCYYEQYWYVDGRGNWTALGLPIEIFCWGGGGLTDITNLPGPGSGGGSGGGSTPPYNNDYEICKRNFDDINSQGSSCSNFIGIEDMGGSGNLRLKKYIWECYRLPTWRLISEEIGEHEFVSTVNKPTGEWTWKSLTHNKIKNEGFIGIISISFKDDGGSPTIGLYSAVMDINFSVTKSLLCKGFPFETTENCSQYHAWVIN